MAKPCGGRSLRLDSRDRQHSRGATVRKIKAWAVVAKEKPVTQENNHLHPLLIFAKKYQAYYAKWKGGEEVRRVTIQIEAE
ncbi:MAG: hypothetical protein KGL39_60225, partial [Patescibacteria group bacterium]|nr:hypothetical protein [Patescibacteria group bacterium]